MSAHSNHAYPFEFGPVRSAGLTKRELIAAMAMQGMLAANNQSTDAVLAQHSVMTADALLAELAKDGAQ